VHIFIACFALVLCGTAFRSAKGRPSWISQEAALFGTAVLVTPAFVFAPSAQVDAVLANSTGAAFSPIFTRSRGIETQTLVENPEWWTTRDNVPDITPSPVRPIAAAPFVILVTIDALRADVLLSGKYDASLPTL